ncbi:hypothetical protein PWR63_27955 [Paraburkholderia sp. A2WS-5]|uniref:hypothetical protein n=1 Tax=unclassified Paraburkholderia TaxID=2615204 RepID=UPI003B7CD615
MRADRPYEEREAHHRRSYLYAFATVAVFVSVFAGYVLSHRNGGDGAPEAQVAQGAVAGTPQESATVAANEPAHAPPSAAAPPASMPSPVAVPMPSAQTAPPPPAAAPVSPPRHAVASHTETAPRGAASLKSLRDERAAAMKHDASLRADISRSLAGARASLDKNNLGPARRSIMSVLAEQPGNGEALQMQSELLAREQDRDLLLGSARLCARQADWVCAWRNAGRALTVDASSGEARDLLSRAMAEQSAKGEREFDPSLDNQ